MWEQKTLCQLVPDANADKTTNTIVTMQPSSISNADARAEPTLTPILF